MTSTTCPACSTPSGRGTSRDVVPSSVRLLGTFADAPPFEVVAVVHGGAAPVASSASPPLRVVHAPGAGPATAFNHGAAAATGELLLPGVAFAVNGCIGASNRWDQAAGAATLPLLDVGGLETLERSGLEIGAHSRTHRSLTEVEADELAGETAGVATDLEGAGLRSPRLFAYPYGDHSAEVRQAVRRAGYAAAFTVSPGRVLSSSDRYALPRVDIRRHHSGLRLRLRVALLGGGRLRRPARLLRRDRPPIW